MRWQWHSPSVESPKQEAQVSTMFFFGVREEVGAPALASWGLSSLVYLLGRPESLARPLSRAVSLEKHNQNTIDTTQRRPNDHDNTKESLCAESWNFCPRILRHVLIPDNRLTARGRPAPLLPLEFVLEARCCCS